MHRPLRGVRRYHIEVTVDQQCPPGRVAARQAHDHVAPARRAGFHVHRLQSDLGQPLGDPLGRRPLDDAGTRVAGVGGVDADEVPGQPEHFVLGSDLTGAVAALAPDGPLIVGHGAHTAGTVTLRKSVTFLSRKPIDW